jgi:hypothetical protein
MVLTSMGWGGGSFFEMSKIRNTPSTDSPHDQLHKIALEHLIKGESPENLLAQLKVRLSEKNAETIIADVVSEYEKIKKSGRMSEAEYELYFDRSKKRTSSSDIIGLGMIAVGIGLSAWGYWAAVPGQTYTGLVPL